MTTRAILIALLSIVSNTMVSVATTTVRIPIMTIMVVMSTITNHSVSTTQVTTAQATVVMASIKQQDTAQLLEENIGTYKLTTLAPTPAA